MIATAAEEDAAVGGPAEGLILCRMPRQPRGLAARRRHDVDVVVALVLRGERDEPSVWREAREPLFALVCGEPHGDAACERHLPQVAFGREDDHAGRDARVAVEAVGRCVGGRARRSKSRGRSEEEGDGEGAKIEAHGGAPVRGLAAYLRR